MITLTNHQFEILPSDEAMDGLVFGFGADVSVETFDPGQTDWITQDSQNTRRGVVGFGRDVVSAKTWIWESHTDQMNVRTAVAALEDLSAAWAPDSISRNPSAVTAIRYRLANRDRRVFGRPRRFAAPPTNLILGGYVPITHDFACVDSFTYDDIESSAEIPYVSAASTGGFVLPAVMPLTTLPSDGNGSSQISVTGNARAYPIIRFNGPWINPSFDTGDWSIQWTGTVPDGGFVEIDCRPWKLTVLDHTGASAVGGLGRKAWLEDCWFAPNSMPQVALNGSAASGAASATVRWRNTWTSI